MAGGPLSAEQVAAFKRDGFVVVPDLLGDAALGVWHAQLQDRFGPEPQMSAAVRSRWPETKGTSVLQDFRFADGADFHQAAGVRAAARQLGGGSFIAREGDSNPHVLWPQQTRHTEKCPWQAATTGHVDGYAGGNWFSFMLGATTYLYDVAPREGGTFLWPGSHLQLWQYYRDNPAAISAGDDPGRDAALAAIGRTQAPVEATMRAGDVLLWHHNLYHAPSTNVGPRPRWGFFLRFHHAQEQRIRHAAPEDLWTYWGV